MTNDTTRLQASWQRSGLAFLGISFQKAMQSRPLRLSLELAVKAETRGKPAPVQPALI